MSTAIHSSGFGIYSSKHGFECDRDDANKIAKSILPYATHNLVDEILKINSASESNISKRHTPQTLNNKSYKMSPSMPRFVGILGLTHYPDKSLLTDSKNEFFENLSINSVMTEYASSINELFEMSVSKILEKCKFITNTSKLGLRLLNDTELGADNKNYGKWSSDSASSAYDSDDGGDSVLSIWKTKRFEKDENCGSVQCNDALLDSSNVSNLKDYCKSMHLKSYVKLCRPLSSSPNHAPGGDANTLSLSFIPNPTNEYDGGNFNDNAMPIPVTSRNQDDYSNVEHQDKIHEIGSLAYSSRISGFKNNKISKSRAIYTSVIFYITRYNKYKSYATDIWETAYKKYKERNK